MEKPQKDGISEIKKNVESLAKIIAKTSLWANEKIVKKLLQERGNPNGSWYFNVRRHNKGEQRRIFKKGVKTDDNNYPNIVYKKIAGYDVKNYTVCHIWDESSRIHSRHYFLSIPNLVLIPSPLSLVDHLPDVKAILKHRSFELYRWKPDGAKLPKKPIFYFQLRWKNKSQFSQKLFDTMDKRPRYLKERKK